MYNIPTCRKLKSRKLPKEEISRWVVIIIVSVYILVVHGTGAKAATFYLVCSLFLLPLTAVSIFLLLSLFSSFPTQAATIYAKQLVRMRQQKAKSLGLSSTITSTGHRMQVNPISQRDSPVPRSTNRLHRYSLHTTGDAESGENGGSHGLYCKDNGSCQPAAESWRHSEDDDELWERVIKDGNGRRTE